MGKKMSVFPEMISGIIFQFCSILLGMVVLEGILFGIGLYTSVSVQAYIPFDVVIRQSHIVWVCLAAAILTAAVLCRIRTGKGSENVPAGILVSQRDVFASLAACGAGCWLVFWAVQAVLILVFSRFYMHFVPSELVSDQAIVVSVYRNGFLRWFVPLENILSCIRNILAALVLGSGCGALSLCFRRKKQSVTGRSVGKARLYIVVFTLCMCALVCSLLIFGVMKRNVAVAVHVLYGDPSAAKGLVINERTYCGSGQRMLWNIRYAFGDTLETGTKCRYSFSGDKAAWGPKEEMEYTPSSELDKAVRDAEERIKDTFGTTFVFVGKKNGSINDTLYIKENAAVACSEDRIAIAAVGYSGNTSGSDWYNEVIEQGYGYCDVLLFIYGKDGLEYFGQYTSSQSICPPENRTDLIGEPPSTVILPDIFSDPLTMEWM